MVIKGGFLNKVTFEQRHEEREKVHHVIIFRRTVLDRGNSKDVSNSEKPALLEPIRDGETWWGHRRVLSRVVSPDLYFKRRDYCNNNLSTRCWSMD